MLFFFPFVALFPFVDESLTDGSLLRCLVPELSEPYQTMDTVRFDYFQTKVVDSQLVFTYQLQSGIIEEQTGLLLLKQTGVLASLR